MSFIDIFSVFSYPFVQRALIVGIIIAVCAAILGVILVLKRYSLIGHGLANVGFASFAFAVAFSLPALYFSIPTVVIASFLIMMLSQKNKVSGDVTIGIVASAALSFGIIITAVSRGFNIDVSSYMFGSILAISKQDVIFSIVLGLIVLSLFVLFYNRLFLITYDESYAVSTGINVTYYQFLISFLTALTVVLGMRMMGTLLISSLIIFPAIIAKRLAKSFKAIIITAAIISAICFFVGIILSYIFNLPTGPSIIVVNLALLILVWFFSRIKSYN